MIQRHHRKVFVLLTGGVVFALACNSGVFSNSDPGVAVACDCQCKSTSSSNFSSTTGDSGTCFTSCQAQLSATGIDAHSVGCGNQYDAYSKCVASDNTCSGNSFSVGFSCSTLAETLKTCLRNPAGVGGAGATTSSSAAQMSSPSTGTGAGNCQVQTSQCSFCLNQSCSSQTSACNTNSVCVQDSATLSNCACKEQILNNTPGADSCVYSFENNGPAENALGACMMNNCRTQCGL